MAPVQGIRLRRSCPSNPDLALVGSITIIQSLIDDRARTVRASDDSETLQAELERWLRGLSSRLPLAVVLGGQANGLGFARSLSRAGAPTLVLSGSPTHTRCARTLLMPDAVEQSDRWLETLERIAANVTEPPVLLPTSDPLVLLVSQNEAVLQQHSRFIVPPAEAVTAIVNKRIQYDGASAAGIPFPATHFPENVEELRQLSATLSYPCILKPYESHLTRKALGAKALILDHADDLISAYQRHASGVHRLMVQDLVPGDETTLFGYFAFWDSDGHERSWFTKQKLRQYPPAVGNGSFQVSVNVPEVAELSRQLLRQFNYRGPVATEFKRDTRDGVYRLMEINPRIGASVQLAVDSGVDFPWIVYAHVASVSRSAPSPSSFHSGVKWIYEELDFRLFLQQRRSGEVTLRRWLVSLRGTKSWAFWSLTDPLPFLFRLSAFLRGESGRRWKSGTARWSHLWRRGNARSGSGSSQSTGDADPV